LKEILTKVGPFSEKRHLGKTCEQEKGWEIKDSKPVVQEKGAFEDGKRRPTSPFAVPHHLTLKGKDHGRGKKQRGITTNPLRRRGKMKKMWRGVNLHKGRFSTLQQDFEGGFMGGKKQKKGEVRGGWGRKGGKVLVKKARSGWLAFPRCASRAEKKSRMGWGKKNPENKRKGVR